MWYLLSVLYHVIPSNCLYHMIHSNSCMPCDIFNLFYTSISLKVSHGIKNSLLKVSHGMNNLKISHGIKQFEGTTWYKTVWIYHMVFQTVLYHVIPWRCLYHMIHSNCFIPCYTFILFDTIHVSHGIKQCECLTWHTAVWRYHMI
jgi:hypothetical protein